MNTMFGKSLEVWTREEFDREVDDFYDNLPHRTGTAEQDGGGEEDGVLEPPSSVTPFHHAAGEEEFAAMMEGGEYMAGAAGHSPPFLFAGEGAAPADDATFPFAAGAETMPLAGLPSVSDLTTTTPTTRGAGMPFGSGKESLKEEMRGEDAEGEDPDEIVDPIPAPALKKRKRKVVAKGEVGSDDDIDELANASERHTVPKKRKGPLASLDVADSDAMDGVEDDNTTTSTPIKEEKPQRRGLESRMGARELELLGVNTTQSTGKMTRSKAAESTMVTRSESKKMQEAQEARRRRPNLAIKKGEVEDLTSVTAGRAARSRKSLPATKK